MAGLLIFSEIIFPLRPCLKQSDHFGKNSQRSNQELDAAFWKAGTDGDQRLLTTLGATSNAILVIDLQISTLPRDGSSAVTELSGWFYGSE